MDGSGTDKGPDEAVGAAGSQRSVEGTAVDEGLRNSLELEDLRTSSDSFGMPGSSEPFERFPDGILAEDALNDGTQAPPWAPSLAPLEKLESASVPELVDLLLGSDRQAGKTDSTNKICALLITHPDVQNHPEALRHCKCRDGETAHVKYSKCVC